MIARYLNPTIPLLASIFILCYASNAISHVGGDKSHNSKYPTSSTIEYDPASNGTRILDHRFAPDVWVKMLVEESNLGSGDVEIGELHFPPGLIAPDHPHGSLEIFYVISGEMVHIVNGKEYPLTPGMVGIVRPGDIVSHTVPGSKPCVVLAIWVPGGEMNRLSDEFIERK